MYRATRHSRQRRIFVSTVQAAWLWASRHTRHTRHTFQYSTLRARLPFVQQHYIIVVCHSLHYAIFGLAVSNVLFGVSSVSSRVYSLNYQLVMSRHTATSHVYCVYSFNYQIVMRIDSVTDESIQLNSGSTVTFNLTNRLFGRYLPLYTQRLKLCLFLELSSS